MADPISWAVGALSAVGSFVGVSSPVWAPIVGGALVGATVGALGSLVFDYDFGEGLLYGALGGLAIGAGLGYINTTFLTESAFTGVSELGGSTILNSGAVNAAGAVPHLGYEAGAGAKLMADVAGGGAGIGAGEAILISGGLQGTTSLLGGVMSGIGQQEMFEDKMAYESQESEKDRRLQEKLAEMNAEAAAAQVEASLARAEMEKELGFATLEENRRQFDDNLVQRMKEFDEQMAARYYEINKPFDEAERMRNIASNTLKGVRIKRGEKPEGAPGVYNQTIIQNTEEEIGATA